MIRTIVRMMLLLLALMLIPLASGQGNFSLVFDGLVLPGNLRFFGKQIGVHDTYVDMNKMKAGNMIFPGVEFRFNQNGRVSFGAAYHKWQLKGDTKQVMVNWGDHPGEWVTKWDESSKASANAGLGTVYVNLLTRGKVRPFIGFGGGIAAFDTERKQGDILRNPDSVSESELQGRLNHGETLQDIYGPTSIIRSGTAYGAVAMGIGGVNIFPTKNLVLTLGGGYLNGPAVRISCGVTF